MISKIKVTLLQGDNSKKHRHYSKGKPVSKSRQHNLDNKKKYTMLEYIKKKKILKIKDIHLIL